MDRDTHLIWESVVNEMSARVHVDDPAVREAFEALYQDLQAEHNDLIAQSNHQALASMMLSMIDRGEMSWSSGEQLLQQWVATEEGRNDIFSSMIQWLRDPNAWADDLTSTANSGAIDPVKSKQVSPSPNPAQFPDARRELPSSTGFQQRGGQPS